jgi:aspartate aminotransferase
MVEQMMAKRVVAVQQALHSFVESVLHPSVHNQQSQIADFRTGDPHELPPAGFLEALQRYSVPTAPDWFAYCFAHEPARKAVAASLSAELGADFAPEDIFLTRGAAGALALALNTVIDPGDEVVFVSPPWFFYEAMILASGATPVRVRLQPPAFEFDVAAIVAVLGPRTRAVLINTPHNPTGRIYPEAVLQRLADALATAAQRHGRPIWIISDEAYSRILFDEHSFVSPAVFHSYSLLARTYSKSTLTPGQRLGYLALAPGVTHAEAMRQGLFHILLSLGLAVPDAVMQYALADIDSLLIDIATLQRRRDRMVTALRDQGYQLHSPQATFYLLPQTPIADDRAFCALLAEQGVAVLPGHVIDLPGYFRLCLTATDETIERSLPIFADAIQHANSHLRN